MNLSDQPVGILCLAFDKMHPAEALHEFEQLFIFSVSQMLKYFTPIQLQTSLNEPRLEKSPKIVLFGQLTPVLDEREQLKKIELRISLTDTERQETLLNVCYVFTDFTQPNATIDNFTPDWTAFKFMTRWLCCQLTSITHPEKVMVYWSQLEKQFIFTSLDELKQFREACLFPEDLEHQETLLSALIYQNPQFFLAQLELGQLQKRKKSYLSALQILKCAWETMRDVSPREKALCATEIGICFALLEEREKAYQWWKTAINEDSSLINPYFNLAHECESANNLVEAEHYFKQITEIAPEDRRAFQNLARLYSKMEAWEKAIEQYQQQLQFEPNDAWTYCNIANCYLQVDGIEAAKANFTKTLSLDPDSEAGRFANFVLSGLQAAEVDVQNDPASPAWKVSSR